MEVRIHARENLLFYVKVFFTVVVLLVVLLAIANMVGGGDYAAISMAGVFFLYGAIIWLFLFFQKIYLVAHLKGNGVAISARQFPEVYGIYTAMVAELGLKKIPTLYLVQEGGLLNAFAVRFSGKNYIAVYSEVFSLISTDIDVLKFVIAHELGHVKRAHMSRRFWTFPSSIIPFLGAAYSRACEYTCDNFGAAFAGKGSMSGLLLLAAGKDLYKSVDVDTYIADAQLGCSFAVKFMGLFMSHPYLPKRLANLELA